MCVTSEVPTPQYDGKIESLAFATILPLSRLLQARKITSQELTRMCLDRLKHIGPRLNCLVSLMEDRLYRQAKPRGCRRICGWENSKGTAAWDSLGREGSAGDERHALRRTQAHLAYQESDFRPRRDGCPQARRSGCGALREVVSRRIGDGGCLVRREDPLSVETERRLEWFQRRAGSCRRRGTSFHSRLARKRWGRLSRRASPTR